MDNASKALMIAGETLIAILVIGLIASAISKFGGFSANMNSKLEKNKQTEFNNNFFAFEGRIDISADEIASIINFAKYSNDSYELFLKNGSSVKNETNFVDVKIKGDTFFTNDLFNNNGDKLFNDKLKSFLQENNEKYYSCDATITTIETDKYDRKVINRSYWNSGDIVSEASDNGRKGYVKSINFRPTSSAKIEANGGGTSELTIKNRNDFIIN